MRRNNNIFVTVHLNYPVCPRYNIASRPELKRQNKPLLAACLKKLICVVYLVILKRNTVGISVKRKILVERLGIPYTSLCVVRIRRTSSDSYRRRIVIAKTKSYRYIRLVKHCNSFGRYFKLLRLFIAPVHYISGMYHKTQIQLLFVLSKPFCAIQKKLVFYR